MTLTLDGQPVSLRRGTPLSHAQRLIWAAQRLHPSSPMANMATATRIPTALDPARFVAAVESVLAQHPILASRVDDSSTEPTLRVAAQTPDVEVVDVGANEVGAWCAERAATPLDATSTLADLALLRHGEHDWTWWCNLHHLVTDAWSQSVLFADIVAVYEGRKPEARPFRPPSFDAPPVDPSIHAHRLALYRPHRTGGALDSTRADRRRVDLSPELDADLNAALGDTYRGLSTDMARLALLVAVTAAYVHRVDGVDQVVVGVPFHQRGDDTERTTIGPMLDLRPITVDVTPDTSWRALHRRASRGIFSALAADPTAPRAPFDVVCNLITATFGPFDGVDTTTTWHPNGHIDPSHRLRLHWSDFSGSGTPVLEIDLGEEVAEPEHAQRAPLHFRNLLAAAVTTPDENVGAAQLVTGDEVDALIAYNATGAGAEPDRSVPAWLIESLRLNSDRTAIRGPRSPGDPTTVSLTGDDLLTEVAATIGALDRDGVSSGDRVGVCMGRSVDTIVTLLALNVAGATFVILDPDHPAARHEAIRNDADLVTVLSERPGAARTVTVTPADMLAERAAAVDLGSEAYVLYTSGSTGTPKGVPITHRGLAEYLAFASETFIDSAEDRGPVVPLFTSLGFDLTITSIFLPFISGGEMVVISPDGLSGLVAVGDDGTAEFIKATPSHLEILCERPGALVGRLRRLVVGGEAFTTRLANRLVDVFGPDLVIHNEYGPTEAVVGCMDHVVEEENGAAVPIGHPAPGVRCIVVDVADRLSPIGAAGELLLHRPGMTSGYLGRPELNAEKFVRLPEFCSEPLYRTGDLVRMESETSMVYLGRIDEQLKVSGVRLEAGEVEAALASHPAIEAAHVGLWTPDPDRPTTHECPRCGLTEAVPGIDFDDEGVCSPCRHHERIAPQAQAWFRTPDDLIAERDRARARATGDHDVLHLLSGGKDSTYALYQLVEFGFRVRTLTLDNGFISEGAKDNVRRAVTDLGLEHDFVSTEHMNEIFRDSLERFSNVCQGCYKALYTLAVNLAHAEGIPLIVTGLSRGQFFETRLTPEQFEEGRFDPDAIDAAVLEARKAYHRSDDAVRRLMDTTVFDHDEVFSEIEFLDFYRYVDVELAEMYAFLDERAPWVRPDDTGRSTNCLVNAAGIHTHRAERGFHNYALPYSWDVRLGHKTRDEAVEELDDPVDADGVARMLAEIGYEPSPAERLTAWYRLAPGAEPPSRAELTSHLAERLPPAAVPSAMIAVESIPLTPNGKIDRRSLPAPASAHRSPTGIVVEPRTPTERLLTTVWAEVLDLDAVGIDDDFFAVGGTSLDALAMVVRLAERLERGIPDTIAFRHRTIRDLAASLDLGEVETDADPPSEGRPAGAGEPQARLPRRPGIPSLGDDAPPLSANQLALVWANRQRPDEPLHHLTHRYQIPAGALQAEDLADALRAVVEHQPSLRRSLNGLLTVEQALEIRHLVEGTDKDAVAGAQAIEPLDLTMGPLVRASLVPGDHLTLVLTVHHLGCDASSLQLICDQIAALTTSPTESAPALGALRSTHNEHSAWQAARTTESDLAWWVDRVPDDAAHGASRALEALSVAADTRAAPGRAGLIERHFDSPNLADGQRALPLVLGALGLWHDRRSGGDSALVGVHASTRDHPDVSDVVGYFLNLLPIHLDVVDSEPVNDYLARVDTRLIDSLDMRHVAFPSILAALRSAERSEPRIDLMVVLESEHHLYIGDHAVPAELVPNGTAVGPATIFVTPGRERWRLRCEFDGNALHQRAAELLLDELVDIIHALPEASASETPVSDVVPTAGDVNGPPLALEPTAVPDLISDAAQRWPERLAASCGTDTMTHAELDDRSAALAAELVQMGVRRGDRVAVHGDRAIAPVVAIAAAWRCGAAYVPLDASYPTDRLSAIVDGARPRVVVSWPSIDQGDPLEALGSLLSPPATETEAEPASPAHAGVAVSPPIILVGRDGRVIGPGNPVDAPQSVSADDPAYVIFTSGSTGRPRGIEVNHGNLAASLAARRQFYADLDGDHVPAAYLLVSSFGFDSSVAGIPWVLGEGGCLVIPTENDVHDPDRLIELVADAGVTHTLMVPGLWQAILRRCGDSERLKSLTTVIVAGEASPDGLADLHRSLTSSELVNEYGPTEATVWATAGPCSTADGRATIGRPIAGVTIRVADRSGRPVPLGTTGECWIAGPIVTSGYVGDDEATSDRFVAAPNADGSETRWYRTGDLVTLRPDGQLEFRGRRDHQMSIGGIRIEPEEIERVVADVTGSGAVLARVEHDHAGRVDLLLDALDADAARDLIRAAAAQPDPRSALTALAEQAAPGPRRLRVWFETADADDSDPETLRRKVNDRLPPGTEVASLHGVPHLDRTPHGKIDRVQQPPRRSTQTQLTVPPPPVTNAGGLGRLLEAWSAVLAADCHSDTDFFDAGGNSLLAVELVTRLEQEFKHPVPIAALIEGRTPAALAALLEAGASGSSAVSGDVRNGPETPSAVLDGRTPPEQLLVPMGTGAPGSPPLVLVAPGGGNLLGYEPLVRHLPPDVTTVGLLLPGADGMSPPLVSIETVARRFKSELEAAGLLEEPLRVLGWSTGGLMAYELGLLLSAEGRPPAFVGMIDTVVPGHQDEASASLGRSTTTARRVDVERLVRATRIRSGRLASRARRRAALVSGRPVPANALQDWLFGHALRAARSYRPRPSPADVVLYRAADSDPATTEGWRSLARSLEVVSLDGSHWGDDGVLTMARVGPLARDLSRRLG